MSNSKNSATLNASSPKEDSSYSPSVYSNYSYEKPIDSSSSQKSKGFAQKVKKFVSSLGQPPTEEYDRKQAEARGEKYVPGSAAIDFGPSGKMPGSGGRS